MYNCNIIYANKHIVIDYYNKKYLIDTGSQISISNNENIEIFDKNYSSFKEFAGKNLDYFSRKVDFNLDGIVGGIILSDYQFQINFLNKQFTAVDALDNNFNLDKYGHSTNKRKGIPLGISSKLSSSSSLSSVRGV